MLKLSRQYAVAICCLTFMLNDTITPFKMLNMIGLVAYAENHKVRVLTRSRAKAQIVFPGKKVMNIFFI